ncbi:mCG148466 [Mus musculus]|nr:mCG148466 [Mus musculus]
MHHMVFVLFCFFCFLSCFALFCFKLSLAGGCYLWRTMSAVLPSCCMAFRLPKAYSGRRTISFPNTQNRIHRRSAGK